ncbi:retrovirus-related pol polyprotein from transposon TNT 1-94 [Tanacetum coccineum]
MDSDKYLEGESIQRPPLFESDHFIYWKNRFETYVKAKDLDLWHIILNGDFPPVAKNEDSKLGSKLTFLAGSELKTSELDTSELKTSEYRFDFASWQQRIRLYCQGKENGVNILKSIAEGPFPMGTIRDTLAEGTEGAHQLGLERAQVYSDLSPEDKDRYNVDIRATNILLQGLPKDIYTLINHYIDAKNIWDNVKMLLEGSELTKEDRESQLYDDFEHFSQNKGETIHDYYVRFAKLINDIRNIKMTMSKMQLNSNFVNNMLPEWGRFVIAVKLNRGLRDSNFDQLYAYLKQHEAHANKNKMMLDRFTQHTVDPLALMSNVSHQQLSLTDNLIENLTNTLALLTESYKTYIPQTNNQLRTSSIIRNQATVQDGKVVVQNVQGQHNKGQGNNAQGAGAAGYGGAQNRVRNAILGQARQIKCYNCNSISHRARNCTQPKRPQNSKYFKDKMLLIKAQENGVALDEEQLLFIAGGQDNAVYEDVDEQPVQDLALNVDNVFQADDYDAFDSDVDEAPTAQTMFMANLSSTYRVYDEASPSYDSDILSEVQYHGHYQDVVCEHHEEHEIHDNNTVVNKSLTTELATYKEQVELYERRARFELTEREQKIDEQLRIVITDRNIKEENLKKELHSVKMQLPSTINHNKSTVEEVTSLKKYFKQKENKYLEEFFDMKALKEKPALYNGHEIIKTNHVPAIVHNTEDTLEIAEMTRKKMNDKMKDPECVNHKVKIAPPDYSKENYLATFKPQKQLTLAQIFWSQDLIKMKEETLKKQTTASRPIKALMVYPQNTPTTLVPRMLPTKSKVKINIFTLIQLFLEFEKICKKRITPTGLTDRERGFEQTKECYLIEVIPFFKTLKEHFEGIQKALIKEIKEMKDIFEELKAEVDQNAVNRKHDEIERKNILITNDNLIADCLSKDVFYITMNSELTVSRFTEMHDAHTIVQVRCLELEAELSNLRDKVQKDDHTELVKYISNIEVVQIVLWYLDSGCSKHMMGDRSRLRNFVKKFIEIVRFGNDHFGAIMGYGDYVIVQTINGKKYILVIVDDYSRFTWVKFLRSKDETPKVVIGFLKQIQVSLNKIVRYIHTDNDTEFVNKDLTKYYERVGISHQMTVLRTPQQNGIVERQNHTLVEAARTMLIFSKALMFLWAEAVATACYTQNRSLIHTRHNKTPYELVHDKKLDLTFFRVFGALCYPTNDSEDLGKLQPTTDIGIFVGYTPSRTGPAPTFLMPGQISSGLIPNPVPAAPYVPPTNKELEILFQPMFDEYLEPPRVERSVSPAPTVPVPVNSAGTPSSTTIDQDAPSPSHSPSSLALQSLRPSSSGDVSLAESTYVTQTLHHPQKMEQGSPA